MLCRGVLALAIYRTESGALTSSIWARNLIVLTGERLT